MLEGRLPAIVTRGLSPAGRIVSQRNVAIDLQQPRNRLARIRPWRRALRVLPQLSPLHWADRRGRTICGSGGRGIRRRVGSGGRLGQELGTDRHAGKELSDKL